MPDHFNLAEAEAMLPRLTPVLREIARLRRVQVEHEEAIVADHAKVIGNGHLSPAQMRHHEATIDATRQRITRLLSAINSMGILVKDLDQGLVDFPTIRDGREVYLCWKLDEPHIAWWHEVSSGFGGRQPLEDDS